MSDAPFSRRALLGIIGFGVGTFLLGLLLSAFLPGLYGEVTAGHSTYSRSLVGHQALAKLLERVGIPVVRCRDPRTLAFRPDFPLLLIEPVPCSDAPDPEGDAKGVRLENLLERAARAGAPVVIVLPKRTYTADPRRPRWILREDLDSKRAVRVLEHAIAASVPEHRDGGMLHPGRMSGMSGTPLGIEHPTVDLLEPQLIAADRVDTPLLRCDEGVLIGRLDPPEEGGPARYLISDPDLLNNRGLAMGDHAALIHTLVQDVMQAEGVVVDESLHGFPSHRSVLQRVFRFPLALIVLHALLLAGLFAWAAATRFGKALTPPPALPPGKMLLLQNTGKLFLAAGDHGGAVRRYLQASMADVAERFAFGEIASGKDRMKRMAALTEARDLPFELAAIARATRRPGLTPADAVELALEVHAWRTSLEHPELAGKTEPARKTDRTGPRARSRSGA